MYIPFKEFLKTNGFSPGPNLEHPTKIALAFISSIKALRRAAPWSPMSFLQDDVWMKKVFIFGFQYDFHMVFNMIFNMGFICLIFPKWWNSFHIWFSIWFSYGFQNDFQYGFHMFDLSEMMKRFSYGFQYGFHMVFNMIFNMGFICLIFPKWWKGFHMVFNMGFIWFSIWFSYGFQYDFHMVFICLIFPKWWKGFHMVYRVGFWWEFQPLPGPPRWIFQIMPWKMVVSPNTHVCKMVFNVPKFVKMLTLQRVTGTTEASNPWWHHSSKCQRFKPSLPRPQNYPPKILLQHL